MLTAEAMQLSLFPATDYEVHPPSHADWLVAFLGIRRPVCRCGDPYESHRHYRAGSDCTFCQCERYGPPVRFKPVVHWDQSKSLLKRFRLA
jgi:hypothetical protein